MRASPFAWFGATLFAVALAFFLYAYGVTFGASATGATWTAVAWDAVLFTGFALHHSLFARPAVRRWVARAVPPELERSTYVTVASLLFLAVCGLWQPVPGIAWQATGWLRGLAYGVMLAGVWLTLRSAAMIDAFELAGLRRPVEPAGDATFETAGPYGWVRHPIYAAWFLIVLGVPTMTGTRLTFALLSGIYLLIGIEFEERTLRRTSGGAYDGYMRRVPYKLLPRVY